MKPVPVVCTALGAAISYYARAFLGDRCVPWFLGALGVSVVWASLTLVLANAPWFFHASVRLWRVIQVYSAAFSIGFSLGLAAGVSQPVRLGLPQAQVIGMYGTLVNDPRAFQDGRGMGYLVLQNIRGPGGIRSTARGKALVFFPAGAIPRLREFGRASELFIEGFFFTSQDTDLVFRAASVHIVKPAPAWEQFRTSIRMNLMARLDHYPWGGLALALLLGVRDTLDTGLTQGYQQAGCSHVLALSGMHLAIVSGVLAFFLRKPLGLKGAALAGAVFVIGYIYLIGDLPSLYRAALMYLLGALALMGAWPRQPALLLGMSFLIQIMVWPESGHTISFILSYLALWGILCIGETLYELIRGKLPDVLAQGLSASLGAFIATGAVVSWCFGMLRPVGIIAGLLIVPLTTLFMVGAMVALVVPIGMVLSLLYDVLEGLVSLAGQVPGLPVSEPVWVLAASLGISILIMVLNNRLRALRNNLVPFSYY
ncbi:MAG: ComEC/Rec2 family competence protein [Treponema sp.]|nr:ComEC/Rec2 family competence protein [Treponema sp.]